MLGSSKLPYAGRRRDKAGVADFFAKVAQNDDIQVFEPREFIEAGQHVTVLGWERSRALDTGHPFESEWAHVFTFVDGKITPETRTVHLWHSRLGELLSSPPPPGSWMAKQCERFGVEF